MQAAIVKLIFQVHRQGVTETSFEFDEQVIVVPYHLEELALKCARDWAYVYESENNSESSSDLRWEFIGLREILPFQLGEQALPLCSGSLFMEDDSGFIEHIRLKSRALEKALPLFS